MAHFSFIATGDHHFDEHRRFDECIRIHDFITQQASDHGVNAVLSGGDLYERASSPRERHAVADWLTNVSDVCPVVIAKGNHDRPHDCTLLARLQSQHPILVEEAAGIHHVGPAAILAVAWPNRASIAAMLGQPVSGSAIDDVAREALRNVLRAFGMQLAQHHGPRILLMHAMVDGSVTSTGQPLIGSELRIGLEDLALAQADIAILSHIHAPQEWVFGGTPIAYAGSSYRTAFGEKEQKSIVHATFDWEMVDGERRMEMAWSRIETPATKMLLLEYTWASDGASGFRDVDGQLFGDHVLHETAGAEVRFRYSFDPDQRDAAKRAAESVKAQMEEVGAVDVKLDARVNSVSKARAEDVAAAPTLREKARLTWKARGVDVADERAQRLYGMLTEIEGDAGLRLRGRGNVRLDSLRLCGFGTFASEVTLDLAAIDGDLVAITGSNGEGKSLALELWAGAMYRETPTHGGLGALVRDDTSTAYVEAKIDAGEVWTIRQTVKASGGGETLLLDPSGADALRSTKVTDYDRWAEKKLPPAGLFFASQFCAQQAGGIASMSASQRKDLVLALKDCDHLEEMAKRARERDTATGKEIAKLAATIAELERRLGGPAATAQEVAQTSLEAARAEAAAADRNVEESRERLRAMQVRADAIREDRAVYDRAVAARADLRARGGVAQDRLAALQGRRAGLSSLLARAGEIRAAVARQADLRGKLDTLTASIRRLEAQAEAHDKDEEAAQAKVRASLVAMTAARHDGDAAATPLRRMLEDLTGKIGFNRQRVAKNQTELLEQADAIQAAVARMAEIEAREREIDVEIERNHAHRSRLNADRTTIGHNLACARATVAGASSLDGLRSWLARREPELEAALAGIDAARDDESEGQATLRAARQGLEILQSMRGDRGADRIVRLRSGHQEIVSGAAAPVAIATATLAADDDAEADAIALPGRIEEGRKLVGETEARWLAKRATLTALERTVAGAGEVQAKRAEAEALAKVIATARDEVARLSREMAENEEAARVCQETSERLLAEHRALRTGAPVELAAKAPHLAMAADRVAGYEADIAAALDEVERLTADLAAAEAETQRRASEVNAAGGKAGIEAQAAGAESARVRTEIATLTSDRERLAHDLSGAELAACDADGLAVAEVTAVEVDGQVATAQAEVDRLAADLAAAPLPTEPPAMPALDGDALAGHEGLARVAHRTLALAEQRLADVTETAARVVEQRASLAQQEQLQADWKLWADTLGKDGLQALEVDAAGPEIARVATDLLHECHGPRWTIARFDTAPAGKKGAKEGCDIIVVDSEQGREGRIETFSPGQRTITGTALTLAVAILSARDGGAKDPTIVLDEAGAALDVENAEAWIAMVRRAREILCARHVLFVSHLPRLTELADACINVKNGQIEVTNA